MDENEVSGKTNGRNRDSCGAHFGGGSGENSTVGFADNKINGANDDDAEQILLQHESVKPY